MAKAKPSEPDAPEVPETPQAYLATRKVSLNGHIYQEGESIAADVHPDEIASALRVGFIIPAQG